MKVHSILIGAILVAAGGSIGQEKVVDPPITIDELHRRGVIGELGVPLGTVIDIAAEIVDGDSLRMKQYTSCYLLKVTHVGGKRLNNSPTLQFFVPGFVSVKLASDESALYEMKHRIKAKVLDASSVKEIETGYVGKKVRLVVYERGDFSGAPHDLPDDIPIWADVGFGFSTSLEVLKEIDGDEPRADVPNP